LPPFKSRQAKNQRNSHRNSHLPSLTCALAGQQWGEVNGVLDEDTMKAIGEFQKSRGLTVSGVPSPRTRKALFQP